MALAPDDARHAQRLLEAYQKRLRERQVQIAAMGPDADPAVTIEAEDLEQRIADLQNALDPMTPRVSTKKLDDAQRLNYKIDTMRADARVRNNRITRLEDEAKRARWRQNIIIALGVTAVLLQIVFFLSVSGRL